MNEPKNLGQWEDMQCCGDCQEYMRYKCNPSVETNSSYSDMGRDCKRFIRAKEEDFHLNSKGETVTKEDFKKAFHPEMFYCAFCEEWQDIKEMEDRYHSGKGLWRYKCKSCVKKDKETSDESVPVL